MEDWEQQVQWYRPLLYDLQRAHEAGEGNHRPGYCAVCFRMQRALVRAVMLVMPLDRVSMEDGLFWTTQFHAERPYPRQ